MKFYPHYLPTIPFATSASITGQSLFLNNFSGIPVDTASLALNITGSTGENGTSALITGPDGPRGFIGSTGPVGDGIYLLPSSRATYCTCNTVVGGTATDGGSGTYICETGTTYYSDCGTIAAGCQVFIDLGCAVTVTYGLYAFNGTVYTATDGTLTYTADCGS
jgi:hypothetical protein